MFYDNTSIQLLVDRIGWADVVNPNDFVLSAQNSESTSLRYFNSFHAMGIVENAIEVMPNPDADETEQNDFLYKMKVAAVRKVLAALFDNNERAWYKNGCGNVLTDVSGTDYSSLITSRVVVFDNAYGYQLAYDLIEMMLSTTRSNTEERQLKYSYTELMTALEGYKNDMGVSISEGVSGKLAKALKESNKILFPDLIDNQKPKIRARRVW